MCISISLHYRIKYGWELVHSFNKWAQADCLRQRTSRLGRRKDPAILEARYKLESEKRRSLYLLTTDRNITSCFVKKEAKERRKGRKGQAQKDANEVTQTGRQTIQKVK